MMRTRDKMAFKNGTSVKVLEVQGRLAFVEYTTRKNEIQQMWVEKKTLVRDRAVDN